MYPSPYNNPAYPPTPGNYGYGAPPPGSFGGAYGAPPSGPYGAPPPGAYGGAYGAPPPGNYGGAYGAPPGNYGGAYGAPPSGPFGAPAYDPYNSSPYGAVPQSGAYGAPHGGGFNTGYGAPAANPYGMSVPTPVGGGYGGAYGGAYPNPVVSPAVVPPVGGSVSVTTTVAGTIPVVYMPIYSYPHSDPNADAVRLRKAMKGLGTDDSTLISIMTHRSKAQLQLIQEAYLREFKKSLEKDIIGDTSGNYCTLLCDLLRPVLAYKIESVRKAVKGIGTRESILIDVISQSSNAEIAQMKSQYPDIERDVSNDTSGNFRKVLLELLKGNRQETNVIDDSKAQAVAHELYKAGEYRLGTNDSKFVDIMTTYSAYFLDRVNYHYTKSYGHSLYKAIEKETSGDY
jgi:hypothetical protein